MTETPVEHSPDLTPTTEAQVFTNRLEVVGQIGVDLANMGTITAIDGAIVVDGYDWAVQGVVVTINNRKILVRKKNGRLVYLTRNEEPIDLEKIQLRGTDETSSLTAPVLLQKIFDDMYPRRRYRAARFFAIWTENLSVAAIILGILSLVISFVWWVWVLTWQPWLAAGVIIGAELLLISIFALTAKIIWSTIPKSSEVMGRHREDMLRLAMRYSRAHGGEFFGSLRLDLGQGMPNSKLVLYPDSNEEKQPSYKSISPEMMKIRFKMEVPQEGKSVPLKKDVALTTGY